MGVIAVERRNGYSGSPSALQQSLALRVVALCIPAQHRLHFRLWALTKLLNVFSVAQPMQRYVSTSCASCLSA